MKKQQREEFLSEFIQETHDELSKIRKRLWILEHPQKYECGQVLVERDDYTLEVIDVAEIKLITFRCYRRHYRIREREDGEYKESRIISDYELEKLIKRKQNHNILK